MNYYKITTILLTLLSFVLLATTIYYANNTQVKYYTVTKNDTIVIHSFDTITIEKTNISYRDVIVLDTIYIEDTALVVEQKTYQDTISTVYFQGINAFIDSIEYRIPRDTIQIEIEKIQTVKEKESFWHNRFVVTAGVYAGYGLLTNKPDIYVSVGLCVSLY